MGGLAEHFGFASALNPYNFGIVGFLINLAYIISRSFHDLSGEPYFLRSSLSEIDAESPQFIGETTFV